MKEQAPIIKILKVKNLPKGQCEIEFEYDSRLLFLISKKLKLKKRPTKKQVREFILKAIEYTIEEKEKNESKTINKKIE